MSTTTRNETFAEREIRHSREILAPLGKAIAAELDGWHYRADTGPGFCDEPTTSHFLAHDSGDGRTMRLSVMTYPATVAGKINLSPIWPTDASGFRHMPGSRGEVGHIKFSGSRPAKTLAADIKRRLADLYSPAFANCIAAVKMADGNSSRATAVAVELAAIIGDKKPTDCSGNPSIHFRPYTCGIHEVIVNTDGSAVQIVTDYSIPVAVAKRLLTVLAEAKTAGELDK